MKNKIYSIVFGAIILICSGTATAQSPASTVVANVLAQMPADEPAAYNTLMKELENTGAEGVKILVGMMKPPGQGENTAVEFALRGLTAYVSGDDVAKNKAEQAFIAALDIVNDMEIKKFVISQLALIGSDASISKLSALLTVDDFSSSAALAIASIGGETAAKTLQMALMSRNTRSPQAQINIIQALGDVQPAAAGVDELLKSMLNTDIKTKTVVLRTLSKVGSKESLSALASNAALTGYKAEITEANDAYIQLIKRVYSLGDTKEASTAAQNLLKNATKAGSAYMRVAALEVIFMTQTDKSKTLMTALKDGDISYRNAALQFASCYADKNMYMELMKMLPKAKNPDKVDILNWLGNEAQCPDKKEIIKSIEIGIDKIGIQTLIQLLDNPDFDVKCAAAITLGSIEDNSSIPALAGMMRSEDAKVVAIAKEVLSSFSGNISSPLANIMDKASGEGKKAALELLAMRQSDALFNVVLQQTNSSLPEVKNTAYNTLKSVVSEKDFIVLCGMLESSDTYRIPLQQAIASSISVLSPQKQTETITSRMLVAGDAKNYLYYPVLSSTGDPAALNIIAKGINEESGAAKDAAFEALLAWKGFEVEGELYNICKSSSPYKEKAVESYISLISTEKMTGENRFIFLRKAMEVAVTDRQKNGILRSLGRTGAFQSMLYAGEFLDSDALKDLAARAVMDIALADNSITGTMVKELLNKAASALTNPDAGYQRQAISKHLDEMPDEAGYASIFNGKDLAGWKGLVADPVKRAKMRPAELKAAQAKADEAMRAGWSAVGGELVFNGKGDNICTEKQYGDFEMYVDWRLDPAGPEADAGIYLRGTPQVQIWDTARVKVGAQVGSGGLYNNKVNQSKPIKVADNKLGEWNTFYIKMIGDRVSVRLNGELVVDNVIMENYWDRSQQIPPIEQLELQAHGSKVYYRSIYVKELKK